LWKDRQLGVLVHDILKNLAKNIIRPIYRRSCMILLGLTKVGRDAYVHHTVHVESPRNINLGDGVHVHYGSELRAGSNGHISLGGGCRIGPNAMIIASKGQVVMGPNGYVGPYSILRGDGGYLLEIMY